MKSEQVAMQFWFWAVASGLSALILPWIVVWFHRRWAAALAVILALAATFLEYLSDRNMPNSVDIRVDIVVILPLLLLAWLQGLGFGIFALFRKSPRRVSTGKANGPEGSS